MTKLVTLTTDWSNSDYYIGAVKATILSKHPDTIFVDISHNIEKFNWQHAGFVLGSLVDDFPEGTIHIIGVDSEPDSNTDIVVAIYHGQYFIGANNGTLGIVFAEKPEAAVFISGDSFAADSVFVEKNVFAEIAKFILSGKDIRQLGEERDDVLRYTAVQPQITERGILGSVIYIDSYGNAITNISRETFYNVIGENKFEILLNSNIHKTDRICQSYKEVEIPEIVCIFNSINLLEVAMRGANAKNLLGLRPDSKIRIDIIK
ncbi:MAG: SAM-dependent chlorinase/fluorinase [Bacteroidales bacterium]|jgi:S-adenosylmethionine hydrolase|nr:SAM-dependent chlorinase/fluorinase [Bacteroidales bacterium]